MGDLAFGEPLGLLQASEYTPWVKAVFLSIKAGTFLRMARQYPVFQNIVELLTPRSLKEKRRLHFEHAVERVDRRLANGNNPDKPDIWSLILEKEGNHLDIGKMHANASIFMVAGTETTATLLSGLTFHLLKNPDKMQKVQNEVRGLSEEDLTLDMLPRLPYMNACFEEALRVYPPVPIGLPRVVPKGGNAICGDWVPANTRVYVSQKAAYSSSLNFKDPESFIPERWLPDTGYEDDKKEVMQPFSYGPRNCVGKNLAYHEMRIIFATVLWHFDLKLCQESESWSNQKVWSVWSKGPLWVKAKPVRL
jgi:cytochrome P450